MTPCRHLLCRCIVLLPLAWSPGAGADATPADAPARTAVHAPAAPSGSTHAPTARKGKAAVHGAGPPKTQVAAAHRGDASARQAAAGAKTRLDFSGRKRVGQASFYAHRFAGRRMADGTPMRLQHHNAASKTLPLGTIAKVTNLRTGKSAVVQIRDRGPYVKGRIVDLSPATARAVGLTAKEGVAPVEVTPIRVPLPDGRVMPGEAASDPLARTLVARAHDSE